MGEFRDVVRARRMTRSFLSEPLPENTIERLVDLAARAPSAGNSQGWHVVALEGEDTARFWDATLPHDRRATFRWQRLLDAPAILLPLADPHAYLDRYSESDKAASGLGGSPDAWPVPYWTVDASMSVMTLLLAATDEGLGALFFGVFKGEAHLRAELGIPDRLELLGAIAIGMPADDDPPGRSAHRPRRPVDDVLHRGSWTGPSGDDRSGRPPTGGAAQR